MKACDCVIVTNVMTSGLTIEYCGLHRSAETLLEFANKQHEVCEDCSGTGRIYKHADPTTNQWVECPYAVAIAVSEGRR